MFQSIIDLKLLDQNMQIVDILAPVSPSLDLLQHRAILLCNEIAKTVGAKLSAFRNCKNLNEVERFIEGDINFDRVS